MKQILLFITILFSGLMLNGQNKPDMKCIFIPHPRSDDQKSQSVYKGIAKIDLSKYDIKMLGGDITYSSSKNRATLEYIDSLFDIRSPNTLWGYGNHDVESGNRSLIKEFTGRDSYYAYYRDKATFMVLDCELNAESFSRTFIKGNQLQMVKNVCDSISQSNFLILLHSRYIWMINNPDLKAWLTDSIAASSRSMDTTNFYSDIYPLLQKVKSRGIQVKVFGGDKSKINLVYSPEDSITFYAARLATDFPDSINNVIVVDYNIAGKTMDCNYISLTDIEKTGTDTTSSAINQPGSAIEIEINPLSSCSAIIKTGNLQGNHAVISFYSITGKLIGSFKFSSNQNTTITFNDPGIYLVKIVSGSKVQSRKLIFSN